MDKRKGHVTIKANPHRVVVRLDSFLFFLIFKSYPPYVGIFIVTISHKFHNQNLFYSTHTFSF